MPVQQSIMIRLLSHRFGNRTLIVVPCLDAAISLLVRLIVTNINAFEVRFMGGNEMFRNRCTQLGMIVFRSQHLLATAVGDLLSDLLLATHRVDRDNRTFDLKLIQ